MKIRRPVPSMNEFECKNVIIEYFSERKLLIFHKWIHIYVDI